MTAVQLDLFTAASDPVPGCFYCPPRNPEAWKYHDTEHLPLTCKFCGQTEPNGYLFRMNHEINLGGTRHRDGNIVCVSLYLQMNHLVYARKYNEKPDLRELEFVSGLGWELGDDLNWQAPPGWPKADHNTKCEAIAL